ncbi:unnamed protein product [Dracunculus medinensis]|uniref:SURF6 domain-containing protein n=1 Tax=Dracunculus medinensis TaxID=318479 RepID=A0A0N4U6L9_DRAME|nr:unnamed protein product [Dracunculus medinensis]
MILSHWIYLYQYCAPFWYGHHVYTQVQRQAEKNARNIREQVKKAMETEIEQIRALISDAIIYRRASNDILSPIESIDDTPQLKSTTRRRKLTKEDSEKAINRHLKALEKLKKDNEARKKKRESLLRRKKEAVKEANIRSKHL